MNYYEKNAEKFFKNTIKADMSPHYTRFLENLPKKAHILDAGCGSGRDTLNFTKKGYKVTAIDASQKMCQLASKYTQQPVTCKKFQEIEYKEEFDGIWASASLLHIKSEELNMVLDKFKKALKKQGILYASFKEGNYEGIRNGRYFTDLTQEKATKIFEENGYTILGTWITEDVRKERNEKWVNILAKK